MLVTIRSFLRAHLRSLLAGQVMLVSAALTYVAVGPLTSLAQSRLNWNTALACEVSAALAAAQVARRLRRDDPARRFWLAVCATSAAIGAGYLPSFLETIGVPAPALPSITGRLPGIGALLLIAVMLTYPLRLPNRRALARFWLDMATVMVGTVAFGWYFSGGGTPGLLDLVTGPAALTVAVFAVAKLLVAGRPPFGVASGVLGAAGAACGGLAGVLGTAMDSAGHGGQVMALSALGDALLMTAAWVQLLQVRGNPDTLHRPRRRPYSTLPYLALAATFTLLAAALHATGLTGRAWGVLAAVGLSTTIVVVRQLSSFAENSALLRALDDKVRELRAALQDRDRLAVQLREMAFTDPLTGLANRAHLRDLMTDVLTHRPSGVAVLWLDLDDFKPVNDTFGHLAGDEVLREVAVRLTRTVGPSATVARLGGDEFALLLTDMRAGEAEAVAARLIQALRRPFHAVDAEVIVGVSVGVAYARFGSVDPLRLLRDADLAMYSAKAGGKNRYASHGVPVG